MGILRADRITGLGGANAITGSVSFAHDGDVSAGESGALQVLNVNSALTFGTDDFTVEFWFYANRVGVVQNLYDGRGTGAGSNTAVLIRLSDANKIQFFTTNAFRITGSTTIIKNAWYHVALTRTSGTHTLYVNGSSDGTWSQSSLTYTGPTNNFAVIGSDDNRDGRYGLNGYISNLRVAKELIYSAAFSVPTTALAPTSNTTLLCCQSPGNVNASFGDTTLTAFASNTNSKGPQASRFTPNSPVGFSTTTDVGSQYGTTFDGFGSFATSTYMIPSGGNTRERNRGRALLGGGHDGSAATNHIHYLNIQSQGNTEEFGDLTVARWIPAATASSTRGVWNGGGGPYVNTIDFVTISSTANATDFGDLTEEKSYHDAVSNETRGVIGGGYNDPGGSRINVLEYITIATTGNGINFGDLTVIRMMPTAAGSSTRGLYMGGDLAPNSVPTNVVDYITIATTGDATDFGDMTAPTKYGGACSSNVRAIYMGGDSPNDSTRTNKIEYFTIATLGNGTDFGDLITAKNTATGATSNNTRGISCAGYTGSTNVNSIEFITIATTGNASDFGDIIIHNMRGIGALSDSHGGLS